MSENRTYLRFECGARLPYTGFLEEPWTAVAHTEGSKPRKKDGRYRLVVFDSEGKDYTRPRTAAGNTAPCLGCPCPRKAGRKKERCFPEKHDPNRPMGVQFRTVITSYPEEVHDEGKVVAG
jgi:hypothetical protein